MRHFCFGAISDEVAAEALRSVGLDSSPATSPHGAGPSERLVYWARQYCGKQAGYYPGLRRWRRRVEIAAYRAGLLYR